MGDVKTILAIDGGGLFGVGVADWIPKLGSRMFDCYAGTSVGSILAACYAIGLEPLKVQEMFNSGLARRIFTKPRLPWRLNWFRPAIYDNKEAQKVLEEVFGDRRVEDVKDGCSLVIVAWNYKKRKEKVFTSDKCNNRYLMRDAVLASMSAPSFFPIVRLLEEDGNPECLGDGGVCGNDPSLAGVAALREGILRNGVVEKIQTRHIKCLSIGTSGVPREKKKFNVFWKLGWLQVVTDIIAQGNASYTSYGVSHLLDDRYLRVSPEGLPDSKMDNFKLLPEIRKVWAEWDHTAAVNFLGEAVQ